ncbi:MAG: hypothetical protein PHE56_00665 [Bacteroidales bacterium]|nr:hypothetical protein [Bacteroidales bacterium]
MKKNLEISILLLIILLISSCITKKFNDGTNQIFCGKSAWTASEIECCNYAINQIENSESTKIIFKKAKIKSMGQAQPHPLTMLRKPENRVYIISVRDSSVNKGLNFSTISDSAKTGLVGHEIFHVMDFKKKNFFQIIIMGYKYSLSKKYKRKTEWETDSLTICNGLGNEVLLFNQEIVNSKFVSQKYLERKNKFYMQRDDILRIIENCGN